MSDVIAPDGRQAARHAGPTSVIPRDKRIARPSEQVERDVIDTGTSTNLAFSMWSATYLGLRTSMTSSPGECRSSVGTCIERKIPRTSVSQYLRVYAARTHP